MFAGNDCISNSCNESDKHFDNEDSNKDNSGEHYDLHEYCEKVYHRAFLCRKKKHSKKDNKKGGSDDLSMKRSNFTRRSTIDTIIFNEMCEKADHKERENEMNEDSSNKGNRRKRRTTKGFRGNERGLKLDMNAVADYRDGNIKDDYVPTTPNHMKIETRNRFRCLRSKPVGAECKSSIDVPVNKSIAAVKNSELDAENFKEDEWKSKTNELIPSVIHVSPKSKSLKEREIFHDTFSFLIRLGSTERSNCKNQMSNEESRWQNELKDLIWLELQAYHADRTLVAQDEYLCKQREAVGELLMQIMQYKYNPNIENLNECSGCLSMYCRPCARSQTQALKEVETLLARLEAAEALYPSSQALSVQYPLYKSSEFTGRVKAMCLWYNMTKHHRLKLLILGKLLQMLHGKKKLQEESVDSGISSRSSEDTVDSQEFQYSLIQRFEQSPEEQEDRKYGSPFDSNNSNVSSSYSELSFGQVCPSTPELSYTSLDFYLMEFDRVAYRKYIEDVLKTRGLRKSLNFLEKLYTSVLRKARLALEKWDEDENSGNEEYEGDQELKRYGVWSNEAKQLNLPSYRAAFVFLSRVPLDVVHEFLRMRLEQKPEQPSPLSVRQLIRELREGLRIACIHRDRFAVQSRAATFDCDTDLLYEDAKGFDESLKAVFEVYLDYLKQWVEMVQHQSFHKNLIEDEWNFVKSIARNISDGYKIAGVKFSEIADMMMKQTEDFLIERPREITNCREEVIKEEVVLSEKKFHLMSVGREWQGMFVESHEKVVRCAIFAKCLRRDIEKFPDFHRDLAESISRLKEALMRLRHRITVVIVNFQADIEQIEEPSIENEKVAMRTRIREILHQAYKMGFDYHKELCKIFLPEERNTLAQGLLNFALLWMEFVRTRCERGRGLRPRWANQGLEFLITVCEPQNTKHLSDHEFEELKTCMDRCISHVVGTAAGSNNLDHDGLRRLPSSRAASPSPSATPNRTKTPNFSQFLKNQDTSTLSPDIAYDKFLNSNLNDGNLIISSTSDVCKMTKHERVIAAIQKLDCSVDERLRSRELIGSVTDKKAVDRVRIKARRVTFTWQRGIKIGQGRFGKVYTVVNNQTGELLAMKEVQFQPGDHRAIQRVAKELQIFEGLQHKHLVKYYGVEIHREEMLIFMEFCAEGTLENLVAGSGTGLPESLVRKFTHQLLLAVVTLHSHGIVHRDIKTANIFLTAEGNCLKLGDFGSAVQIKAHTTMPGELQGFVGTQAYMAPEVFMKTESGGHGRAVDIWSIGCCVIEMASGRRPWSEYLSNYQIMFKVGMGESPMPPKNLSNEGIDFIEKCLQHDPRKRSTAQDLLNLPFAAVYEDVNADLTAARYI